MCEEIDHPRDQTAFDTFRHMGPARSQRVGVAVRSEALSRGQQLLGPPGCGPLREMEERRDRGPRGQEGICWRRARCPYAMRISFSSHL
jgi:hypothetical protein